MIEILYYPTEYTMTKTVNYPEASKPKLEAPTLQYSGGTSGSLSFDLFYDTYEYGTDVRVYTDKITDLLKIEPEIHSPPPLKFIWGMETKEPFIGVLERVTKNYTMFLSDGIPVRAKLKLELKEYKMGLNQREETMGSPDKTKIHITQRGDSLWMIANRVYGNVGLWRPIAERNKIKNPKFLEPGIELIIPPLE